MSDVTNVGLDSFEAGPNTLSPEKQKAPVLGDRPVMLWDAITNKRVSNIENNVHVVDAIFYEGLSKFGYVLMTIFTGAISLIIESIVHAVRTAAYKDRHIAVLTYANEEFKVVNEGELKSREVLQAEVADLQARIAEAEQSAEANKTDMEDLRLALEQAEGELAEAQAETEHAQAVETRARNAALRIKKRIDEFRGEFVPLAEELANANESIERRKNMLKTVRQNLLQKNDEVEELTHQFEAACALLNEETLKLIEANRIIDSYKELTEQSQEAQENYRRVNKVSQTQIQALTKRLEEREALFRKSRDTNGELEKTLNVLADRQSNFANSGKENAQAPSKGNKQEVDGDQSNRVADLETQIKKLTVANKWLNENKNQWKEVNRHLKDVVLNLKAGRNVPDDTLRVLREVVALKG
ncbi:MAG: hypothetical protein S4CHLAM20_15180 [Chlamydiia bacterium]|nr:hypothetical protein [Chlamydiia bacterium]